MSDAPTSFLGLPPDLSAYDAARFVVLPVPYDGTTSYLPGTRLGPAAVIAASQQVEWYDPELQGEFVEAGISTLAPVEVDCSGPQVMEQRICATAQPVIQAGKFLLALGGEHGITAGLVRAAHRHYPDLSILQIDAHADLRDSYQGSKFSHAAVMRRVHDLGVRGVGVGIRSYSLEEARFLQDSGSTLLTAEFCCSHPDWIQRALSGLSEHVYLTVDIDGFDPAVAPGTGTPEPGGLTWQQVTALVRTVSTQRCIVAADIVEVMPLPGQVVTEFLAARLGYKIISYVQAAAGSV